MVNVYIHIPFCQKKCSYCNFYSVIPTQDLIKTYFSALTKELNKSPGLVSDTIYIGGGTPSLVNPYLIGNLLTKIKKTKNCEITLEANPETITEKKLKVYKNIGINRLSFGLQAWQNKILNYLGRNSKAEDFLHAFKTSRKLGFNNIDVDLIFGIYGQTLDMWQQTVEKVIELNPEHISCYSLELNKRKLVKTASEILDRKMYHWVRLYLIKHGFHHYEISNFAKHGFECKHNLNFWNSCEFLGFGAGAHSFINKTRLSNSENLGEYSQNKKIMTEKELDSSKLRLKLRLIDGFVIKDHLKQINYLKKIKLITYKKNIFKLTPKGMDLENQVALELIDI